MIRFLRGMRCLLLLKLGGIELCRLSSLELTTSGGLFSKLSNAVGRVPHGAGKFIVVAVLEVNIHDPFGPVQRLTLDRTTQYGCGYRRDS
ncbi:hypothetical protein HYQ46_012565 [Verticillium longisporum]|nr:hypothetical protein HYQ46_012565 [Verticillium longisporum]